MGSRLLAVAVGAFALVGCNSKHPAPTTLPAPTAAAPAIDPLETRADNGPYSLILVRAQTRPSNRDPGAVVLDADGSEVGKVTSGGFAPSVGAPIAMAYVPAAMAAPGTVIQIAQRGKVHQATVTAMPFVPHRYVRAGGK